MIALGARVVLALVLVVAAVAKWRDRDAVAAQYNRAIATLLPVGEIVLAIALVTLLESPIPGIVAAALLVVFSVVVVRAIARHEPCACFGASSQPPGTGAILRNGALLALAILATGSV